jgi:hypothetical protein
MSSFIVRFPAGERTDSKRIVADGYTIRDGIAYFAREVKGQTFDLNLPHTHTITAVFKKWTYVELVD